jgi:opacity protein-like surface antigen
MKKTLIALSTLMALSISGAAFAEHHATTTEIANPILKKSISLQINNSRDNSEYRADGVLAGNQSSGRVGIGALFKVQYNPYVGFEAGYTDLGRKSGDSVTNVNARTDVRSYAIPVRFVGTYPITDKISAKGKIGLAYVNSSVSEPGATHNLSSTKQTYGVGVDYELTKDVSLSLDLNRYFGQDDVSGKTVSQRFQQVALGVNYQF